MDEESAIAALTKIMEDNEVPVDHVLGKHEANQHKARIAAEKEAAALDTSLILTSSRRSRTKQELAPQYTAKIDIPGLSETDESANDDDSEDDQQRNPDEEDGSGDSAGTDSSSSSSSSGDEGHKKSKRRKKRTHKHKKHRNTSARDKHKSDVKPETHSSPDNSPSESDNE